MPRLFSRPSSTVGKWLEIWALKEPILFWQSRGCWRRSREDKGVPAPPRQGSCLALAGRGVLDALSPLHPTLPSPLQSLVPQYCREGGTNPAAKGRAQSRAREMLFQVRRGWCLPRLQHQLRELLAAMCRGSELFLSDPKHPWPYPSHSQMSPYPFGTRLFRCRE